MVLPPERRRRLPEGSKVYKPEKQRAIKQNHWRGLASGATLRAPATPESEFERMCRVLQVVADLEEEDVRDEAQSLLLLVQHLQRSQTIHKAPIAKHARKRYNDLMRLLNEQ